MKALGWAVLAAALAAASLQANYTYYLTDSFASICATCWHQNGVVSLASGVGLTSADTNGGSLISLLSAPTGHVKGEIDSVLAIGTTSGTIVHYHAASLDARSGPAASGSYIAAELRNAVVASGVCSATLVVEQRVGNVVTDLVSMQVGCKSNSVLRTVLSATSNTLYVFIDNYLVTTAAAPALAGSPGIGLRNCGAGTGIAQTQLGALDTVAPGAIPSGTLRGTPSSNQIELQWGGAADDAAGVGIGGYAIYRKTNPSDPTSSWVYFALTPVPDWVDLAAQPNTTYAYNIYPYDADYNFGPASTVTITTPAASTVLARRVGVRPTGAYWGAGGEQIDLFSGNLNVTVPLLKPVGRGGMSAPINLAYNSQLWREDANGTWNLGGDVGFGYGWRLVIGSIMPVYNGVWTLDHYVYTDSTGAQYRLDTKENGLWRSSEGIYVRYDDTKNWLILPDGNFLEMGVVSQGAEWDAGTRYPSRAIDTSGNYISFQYAQGALAAATNSSSRLTSVQDPRVPCQSYINYAWVTVPTYTLSYDSSLTPHLTSVTSCLHTAEAYSLQYSQVPALSPPFGVAIPFGASSFLTTVSNSVTGTTNSFSYDASNSGELTQMTTPYGGTLQWGYASFTNSAGMTHREVSSRSVTTLLGGTAWNAIFSPGLGDTALQLHAQRQVLDSQSGALRNYFFQSDPTSPYAGLLTGEQDYDNTQTHQYRASNYTWSQDPWGHPYVAESDITQDPGTSSAVTAKTTQAMAANTNGAYGQIRSRSQYSYDNLTTPARVYNYWYTALSGLTSIWRQTSADLTASGSTKTLFANDYSASYSSVTGATMHDSSLFASFPNGEASVPRGLSTHYSSDFGTTRSAWMSYDITGNLTSSFVNGLGVSYTADSANGRYMLPAAVTPNGNSHLTSGYSWAPFLGLTQEAGPNGATTTIGYDWAARPSSTTSPDGAVTNYSYENAGPSAPATVSSTINGRWTIATLDGLGRTVQTDTGTGTRSTTNSVSRVLTAYGPCACTPAGKVMQVSRPFNPNTETPVYTTYTYDALGRTTSIIQPANSGSTTYVYAGNTVTVTDPGGRWKKYTSDVFGNVTQVNEPNPSGGPDYVTNYTYNAFDKLTNVSMPRTMPGGNVITQTRTFVYDSHQQLASVTHPESGTTTYTYDAYGRVATKTDAKSNVVTYTYDTYGRLTQIQRTPGAGSVEPEPITTFTYDSAPAPTGFHPNLQWSFDSTNTWGRLAMITHGSLSAERFQYTASGRISAKTLSALSNFAGYGQYGTQLVEQMPFKGSFTWDNEGRITGYAGQSLVIPLFVNVVRYMSGGSATWSYDAMGRPASLTFNGDTLVTNAQYNAAGQITSYSFPPFYSSINGAGPNGLQGLLFTYNAMGQLVRQYIPYGATPDITYQYSDSANDGRIQSRTFTYPVSRGSLSFTSAYTYDSLGRLATVNGNQLGFDPFGNLMEQTNPALSIIVDPTTNRISTQGFGYDAAGNLVQGPNNATYTYDSENRLSRNNDNSYYYAANGQQLASGTTGGSMEWRFIGPNGIEVTLRSASIDQGAASTMCGDYSGLYSGFCPGYHPAPKLYFAGRLIYQGPSSTSIGGSGGITVTDRLGSAVQESYPNSAGSDFYITDYSPFGTPTYAYQPRVSFATYEGDRSGLLYAKNRYYDPARGRFTTPDPSRPAGGGIANPLSWNRYAYTRGDPVNFADPSGLEDCPAPCYSATTTEWMLRPGGLGGIGSGHVYMRPVLVAEGEFGGDGGGNGSLMVKNLAKSGKKYDQVANTFRDILGSIDSDCLGFLQSGGNNVQSYVSDLLSSNLLGVGDFTTTIAAFTGTGNTSLAPGDAAIVVNNNSAFFNSNYTVDQGKLQGGTAEGGVFILLHELGHALGANGFQSDYNNKSAGTANDKLIDQNCQKTLSKFQ